MFELAHPLARDVVMFLGLLFVMLSAIRVILWAYTAPRWPRDSQGSAWRSIRSDRRHVFLGRFDVR